MYMCDLYMNCWPKGMWVCVYLMSYLFTVDVLYVYIHNP